ncbi:hypothetical protein F5Y18DRAFT_426828 [Xylariaceae sp. FL1019]|nr:hypothetical protein F5Y18DRAFT_426828 [Xylariaceae sp. FL1019]
MGRRPNPLIIAFFERGAKLNDNSNRYHHRCKACGEDFPKGRIDSLTTHLAKKCPAISRSDRINAVFALNGIKDDRSGRPKYDGLLHSGPNTGPHNLAHPAQSSMSHPPNHSHLPPLPQTQLPLPIWNNPLETLAEASRQIEAHEKHDDQPATATQDPTSEAIQTTLAAAIPNLTASGLGAFDLQEQYTLEHPPLHYDGQSSQPQKDATAQKSSDIVHEDLTLERLQQLMQSAESPAQTAVSVAAAATARLTTSLLDPQLMTDAAIAEQIAQAAAQAAASTEMLIDYPETEKEPATPAPTTTTAEVSTPWSGMTYMSDDLHGPATVTDHSQNMPPVLNRGGYRMDTTSSPNGPRHRHARAKFDSSRRREVQEVRRIGACIRCRILRKTCSKGTPCDTCKKVLCPRVWRTGCVRTLLSEYIDLYSAGIQVVIAQKRINVFKDEYHLENTGVVVQASHFLESGQGVTFQVLQGYPKVDDDKNSKTASEAPVILLDSNREDVPGKVEGYMRHILAEYIAQEPSHHVRVTLEVADRIAKETNDELLKRALELWGIVEMMDRERQWTMVAKSPNPDVEDYLIKDDAESEAYSNICMQLTAAAERKACSASQQLLELIQRGLQDGKTKLGFPMFLTVMLFLNCLEKTTWAFKAWDQENLRPKWPLDRPPGSYTNQGHTLTELLITLLDVRHALPETIQDEPDTPIVATGSDPVIKKYYQDLNVTPRYLQMRIKGNNFLPTDSRSLEFLFCAALMLKIVPDPSVLQASPLGTPSTPPDDPQNSSEEVHQEIPQTTSPNAPPRVPVEEPSASAPGNLSHGISQSVLPKVTLTTTENLQESTQDVSQDA